MNTEITLGRGIAVIVDAMLKVSMLKPAQENSIPQQPRPRVRFDNFSNFIHINCDKSEKNIRYLLMLLCFVAVTNHDVGDSAGLRRGR